MSKKPTSSPTHFQKLRAKNAKAMAESVRAGKSFAEVAAEFGKSTATVRLACVHHHVNYPRQKRGAKSKVDQRKPLADAVRGGKTVAEVAAEFGQSSEKVRTACREQNVRLLRANAGSMKILAGIISGKSQAEVARDFNISKQRVNQVVEDAENSGVFAAIEKAHLRRMN